MASTAYLEVTFTKNIQKQSNFTDSDLGKNFKIESTIGSNPSTIIPIIQATIINNKVRLQISDDDVPKQETSITLTYTDNSGNLGFGLVDASTGFPIKDLEPVKDAVKTETDPIKLLLHIKYGANVDKPSCGYAAEWITISTPFIILDISSKFSQSAL